MVLGLITNYPEIVQFLNSHIGVHYEIRKRIYRNLRCFW